MAYPQGINFRQTSGYVTDGANEDYEIYTTLTGTGNYPRTSAQGNNVGWENGGYVLSTRDREASLDRRVAGTNFINAAAANYRMDLDSTGSRDIRLAGGDYGNSLPSDIELFDTSSSLGVLSSGTPGAANFKDAVNATYSAGAWPGSNTAVTKSFSTTICRFALTGDFDCIAHVNVSAAASVAPSVGLPWQQQGAMGAMVAM